MELAHFIVPTTGQSFVSIIQTTIGIQRFNTKMRLAHFVDPTTGQSFVSLIETTICTFKNNILTNWINDIIL